MGLNREISKQLGRIMVFRDFILPEAAYYVFFCATYCTLSRIILDTTWQCDQSVDMMKKAAREKTLSRVANVLKLRDLSKNPVTRVHKIIGIVVVSK